MASQDMENDAIGQRLGMPRQMVSKWRKRFYDERLGPKRSIQTRMTANVAGLVSYGKGPFSEFPSVNVRELRSLLSLRRRLKKLVQLDTVRIKNHLIDQEFPERDDCFRNSEGPAVVKGCPHPRDTPSISLSVRSYPQKQGEGERKRLWDIHTKAKASRGCEATEALGLLIHAVRQLDAMT